MAFLAKASASCGSAWDGLVSCMAWCKTVKTMQDPSRSSTDYSHGSARLLELVPDFIDDLIGNAD